MAEQAKTKLTNAEIGDKIKRLRSFRGLTCAELAETIGCTRPYLSAVENGRYPVSTKILRKLTKTLNVNPDYFTAPGEPDIEDTTYYTRDRLASMPEAITSEASRSEVAAPFNPIPISSGPGNTRRIPFVALSPANKTNVEFDEIPRGDTDTIECPGDVTDSRAFAVRMDGDAMAPYIPVGAMAIVAPNLKVREGKPVMVKLTTGEVLCRLYHPKREQVVLVPHNPAFGVSVYDAGAIEWAYPVVKVIIDTYNNPAR